MNATGSGGSGPYVGLQPFDAEHADYFFGRSAESEVIAHNVLARPFMVLFGASGVGKSSVLNVGLPQALRELDVEARIVTRRRWHDADELDWLRALNAQAAVSGEAADSGVRDSSSKRLIIVLDQFEEFLHYADPKRARDFAKALARFVARRDVEVHALFSLRDYGLHRLEAIRSELPHLLEATLELRRLDEAGVRDAIGEPLKVWNARHGTSIETDADFTETLIEQLRAVDALGRSGRAGGIDLSYLQLALQKIWDVEQGARKGDFRKLRTSTLTTRLKGIGGIARAHVDEVLDQLSPQDQALCSTLVDRLVTPSGGKVLYAATDLARVAQAPAGRMEAVAALLSTGKNRLLREVPLPGGKNLRGYEIQHDILARPFLDWLAARERAEAARRRRTGFAVQFVVLAAIFLGLSLWFIDRQERMRREDALIGRFAQPQDGRERRLLSSLYLLRERSGGSRPDAAIDELEKQGRLPHDRSQDEAASDLADAKQPAKSSLLLARMDSWLERQDLLQAQQARDALRRLADEANGADRQKASDALKKAQAEWDRWPIASPEARKPHGLREEASQLLGLAAARPTDQDPPRLPVVHLNAVDGDAETRVLAVSDDLTVRVWKADSGAATAVRAGCEPGIFDAALSPDGNLLAAACQDGTVRLWDLECADVEVLKGDTDVVQAIAFSPDGQRLAAAARNGAVRIWHVQGSSETLPWKCGERQKMKSKEVRILRKRDGRAVAVLALAFSRDGKQIVTASRDRTASVWDTTSGDRLAELRGHSDWVTAAAFSPDGKRVVTASYDGTARVWDWQPSRQATTGHGARASALSVDGARVVRAVKVLQGHVAQVVSAVFSPDDGEAVLTASADGTVRLWGMLQAEGRQMRVLPGAAPMLTSAVFGAGGRKVLAASRDGVVRIWDADSGRSIGETRLRLGARRDAFVYPVHFDIAWKLANGQPRSQDDAALLGVYRALFAEKKRAAVAENNALAGVEALERRRPGTEHALLARSAWQSVREERDRKFIVGLDQAAASNGSAAPATLGAALRALSMEHLAKANFSAAEVLRARRANKDLLTRIAFSADGRRVATASYDGTVHLWERSDGDWKEAAWRLEGLDRLTSVAFSPDGKRVVTASYDGCARVWDWDERTPPQQRFGLQGPDGPRGRPEPIYSAEFSPDGTRVVTASRDGTARVWELDESRAEKPKIERCRARAPGVPSLTLAPAQVLSHDFGGDAKCVPHGDHHHHSTLHSVASAAFSGDGKFVLTGSADGCARIWDWARGDVVRVLPGHTQRIHMAAFGPGASAVSVVTASQDGTARVWPDWREPGDPAVLGKHVGEVYGAAISPDGARVVTAADDGARVWVRVGGTYELRGRLRMVGRAQPVYSAAWEPGITGDLRIATASEDGVARLWNAGDELDAGQFATALNYRIACTLAESFAEIGCSAERSADAAHEQANRLLAGTWASITKADLSAAQKAFGALRDSDPDSAQTMLAALAVGASGLAPAPATEDSTTREAVAMMTAEAPGRGPWGRLGALLDYARPPVEFAGKKLGDVAMAVVVWPIWLLGLTVLTPLVRLVRGRGTASSAAPDPLRRAWAGAADFALAVALGLILGGLAGMLPSVLSGAGDLLQDSEFRLGYRGWEVGLVVFTGVSSAYLLLRDAIRYQFRRSIGKVLFGLLPLAQGDAEIGFGASAKRNTLAVLIYLFVLLPCSALIVWPHWRDLPVQFQPVVVHVAESFLVAPWRQLGYEGFVVVVFGLTALGLVDLALTSVGDGRALHDRLAKTRVVSLWTGEPGTASEGDAPSGDGASTASDRGVAG